MERQVSTTCSRGRPLRLRYNSGFCPSKKYAIFKPEGGMAPGVRLLKLEVPFFHQGCRGPYTKDPRASVSVYVFDNYL